MYWIGTWLLQLQAAAARERGAGVASAVNHLDCTHVPVLLSVSWSKKDTPMLFFCFNSLGKTCRCCLHPVRCIYWLASLPTSFRMVPLSWASAATSFVPERQVMKCDSTSSRYTDSHATPQHDSPHTVYCVTDRHCLV